MILNHEQSQAMKQVHTGRNLYISGSGGVGKSFLLKEIYRQFKDTTIVVTPTGISALNVGGATIHRTFQFPIHILTSRDYKVTEKLTKLLGKDSPVKRIIIDEISMVRADTITAIDQTLRKVRRHSKPFGGLQMIMVGDFFQLPPVVSKNEYEIYNKYWQSNYAFGTEAWSYLDLEHVELKQIMRQSDEVMITHLNRIRKKEEGWQDSLEFFNQVGSDNLVSVLDTDPIFLCSINRTAETINGENYNDLDRVNEYSSEAIVSGAFREEPAPRYLNLRYGAKLICVANVEEGLMNGQVCYYLDYDRDRGIKVLVESTDREMWIDKHKWDQFEYEVTNDGTLTARPVASYMQYPFKLGWAITIHKSQGMSIDNAVIDVGTGLFTHGQGYVALSRLKTLEGLGLMRPMMFKDIIVDREVIDFYKNDCKGIGLF